MKIHWKPLGDTLRPGTPMLICQTVLCDSRVCDYLSGPQFSWLCQLDDIVSRI